MIIVTALIFLGLWAFCTVLFGIMGASEEIDSRTDLLIFLGLTASIAACATAAIYFGFIE